MTPQQALKHRESLERRDSEGRIQAQDSDPASLAPTYTFLSAKGAGLEAEQENANHALSSADLDPQVAPPPALCTTSASRLRRSSVVTPVTSSCRPTSGTSTRGSNITSTLFWNAGQTRMIAQDGVSLIKPVILASGTTIRLAAATSTSNRDNSSELAATDDADAPPDTVHLLPGSSVNSPIHIGAGETIVPHSSASLPEPGKQTKPQHVAETT